MKILITGGSGSGKTTLLDRLKDVHGFKPGNITMASVIDLDKIGYRDERLKWMINLDAVRGLLKMKVVIHAGTSENIQAIAELYETVIVLDNKIDDQWIDNVKKREVERQSTKKGALLQQEVAEMNSKLEALKRGDYVKDFAKKAKYPGRCKVMTSQEAEAYIVSAIEKVTSTRKNK